MKKKHWLALSLLAWSSVQADMVLRRGNGSEPKSIDPQIAEGVPESNILRDLFEGLTTEDAAANIIPGIAESWTISEDGKQYTFKLRQSAWSDGTPLTAHDVVFGWQRAVNPETGSNYAFILYPVKNAQKIATGEEKDLNALGVKALDDLTLQVELENPTPYFLGMLAHNVAYPAPKHVVEKHGKAWTRPENMVSNGAFKLESWSPNASLVAVKSDAYWNKDQVKLDKVIFYPIEDQNSELKRYRAGELDMTHEIPNDQIQWIRDNLGDELKIGSYLGTYYYGFNTTKPPFKDNPKLREALSLAIDRDIIVQKVTGVGEKATHTLVPDGVNGYTRYTPESSTWSQKERNEKAKALYAEAGYSKDNPLKVELLYNTSENHKKIAIAVAAMWKQVLGVEASLTNKEWKVFLQERKEKQVTQIFRAGWIGDYNDPYSFLELFGSASNLNDVGFADQEYDNLLAQTANEQDAAKRFAIMQEAEKRFIDSYALAPIYNYVTKRLVKPHVKGYTSNVMDHVRSQYISIE